jgi:glycosyltransferase involved in cell wall biosynthesis
VAAVSGGILRSTTATGKDAAETAAATHEAKGGQGKSAAWRAWWTKKLAVKELKRMIEREKPDIIHVKGRLITEAWPVFPSERTIYQHALMGTRDRSWEDSEAEAFSVFLNRVAKVLVQGKGIAETFAKSFNINRPIDVVFTMAPDEAGGQEKVSSEQDAVGRVGELLPTANCPLPTGRSLRFGILCRFTEQKGIVYILEALKMYREKHGAVDFTFAGQGPLESTIRSTVDSWQLAERTEEKSFEQKHAKSAKEEFVNASGVNTHSLSFNTITPATAANSPQSPLRSSRASVQNSFLEEQYGIRIVPVTTAVDILREMDVFVHPGLDDAMPVSIVEALMCGVPCIVSNVGASPELVRDGVEGLVIQPSSAEQILAAMERFAAMTAGELAGFKTRARARYQEVCRPEVVGCQVAGIYKEVIRSGPCLEVLRIERCC